MSNAYTVSVPRTSDSASIRVRPRTSPAPAPGAGYTPDFEPPGDPPHVAFADIAEQLEGGNPDAIK